MEQNDTNNNSATTTPIGDKKPGLQIAIMVGTIVLIFLYVTVWVPRQECAKEIEYHPAGSPVKTNDPFNEYRNNPVRSNNEFYSYNDKDFKTKGEAISYCASNK